MTNQKNSTTLKNFIDSGIFLPLLLFTVFVIANHILYLQKNFIDFNWRFIFALFGGCVKDLSLFCVIAFIFHFISKALPILKKPFIFILHTFIAFPILDYYYFKGTLERFNWIVLQFVNYHSTMGYLGNMGSGFIYLSLAIVFFAITCFISCKKTNIFQPKTVKPIAAFTIFLLFACLFTKEVYFPIENNFTGHIKTVDGKNRILKNLIVGSLNGFFPKNIHSATPFTIKPYTDAEKNFLTNNGLIATNSNKEIQERKFDRLIMIVLESFAYEYLHSTNEAIPAEATPYLDYLMTNYPHLTNFYTSDFPSLQGFNVLLSSKIPFNEKNHMLQKHNLAAMFEKVHPHSTWFLRGSSRVYGQEEITVENVFGFSKLIGLEDLAKSYPKPSPYTWGYNDTTLYAEALNQLSQMKEKNYLMVLKLLNQHQPIGSLIVDSPGQPRSVKEHPNDIVKAIYDADKLLKEFITVCDSEGIFDERTLIIVTADHYPPLGYGHTDLVKPDSTFQLGKLPLIFITKQKQVFSMLKAEKLCCQLDVAPTICPLLGLQIPDEYMGQNLLQEHSIERSIGILNNETVFVTTNNLSFSENLSAPATTTASIKKWINNLNACLNQE